jgi:tetratricopeptide (TPR) repeat protein
MAGAWQSLKNQHGHAEGDEAMRRAAARALDLDPELAEAHAAMGAIYFDDWKWPDADKEFQRALELNPDSVEACSCYAIFLSVMVRFPQAVAIGEHAVKINPFSTLVQFNYGFVLRGARKYDEAASHFRRAIELSHRTSMLTSDTVQKRPADSRTPAVLDAESHVA